MVPGVAQLDAPALPTTKAALQAAYAEVERVRIARQNSTAQPPPPQMTGSATPFTDSEGRRGGPRHAAKRNGREDQAGRGSGGAEAAARRRPGPVSEGGARRGRFRRAPRALLVQSLRVSVAKGPLVRVAAGASSAKRSARMFSAASATCCRPSSSHPAMLVYLDNAQSDRAELARPGANRKRGLNENLAREILELHTLGVDGGYTPGRRDGAGAHHHRLDVLRSRGPARRAWHASCSSPMRTSPATTLARQGLCRRRRQAGRGGARRPGAASGDGAPYRREACAPSLWPMSRRQARRPAGRDVSGDRRRPQGRPRSRWSTPTRRGPPRYARCARPTSSCWRRCGHRPPAGRPGPAARIPQRHGHAAVAAAGTQRMARHGVDLGLARGHQIASRCAAAIAARVKDP